MFLNLKELTEDQLNEKLSELYARMSYMNRFGSSHSGLMYEQCLNWIEQINIELQEREMKEISKSWSPGTVDIIGEESDEVRLLRKQQEKEKRKK